MRAARNRAAPSRTPSPSRQTHDVGCVKRTRSTSSRPIGCVSRTLHAWSSTMATHDRDTIPLEPRKPAAITPPMPSATPDVFALLKALKRRWVLATTLGVLIACVGGVTTYLLFPARFTAFTLLHVNSKP